MLLPSRVGLERKGSQETVPRQKVQIPSSVCPRRGVSAIVAIVVETKFVASDLDVKLLKNHSFV